MDFTKMLLEIDMASVACYKGPWDVVVIDGTPTVLDTSSNNNSDWELQQNQELKTSVKI